MATVWPMRRKGASGSAGVRQHTRAPTGNRPLHLCRWQPTSHTLFKSPPPPARGTAGNKKQRQLAPSDSRRRQLHASPSVGSKCLWTGQVVDLKRNTHSMSKMSLDTTTTPTRSSAKAHCPYLGAFNRMTGGEARQAIHFKI